MRLSRCGLIDAYFSDKQLSDLLDKAEPLYAGIGGKAVLLEIEKTKIFVKKIPLTDLERKPENIRSTANLFELPMSYHIGVGSAGFSSWRELFIHEMTTSWVISGACQNFPILYHWRVLPTGKPKPMDAEELEKLERDVEYWDNSTAVRKRLEAIHNSSAGILLFLEYVPQTLDKWLGVQLTAGGEVSEKAITLVDKQLKETNDFMLSNGFIHFDAHFDNILADNYTVYFSDFGLSFSAKFENTKDELALLDEYKTYDQCSSAINLLHSTIASLLGKDRWEITLKDVPNDKIGDLEPPVTNVIKRYAAIALVMADFYKNMQKVSKSTPYPAKQFEEMLAKIDVKDENTFAIQSATEKESDQVSDKLIEFNRSKVVTDEKGTIYKNYIIKSNYKIIAGINSVVHRWGALHIESLIVDQDYRTKGLGGSLLQKIENEAKDMGATLAHLESFDFQSKDFYLKRGYKVFAELENCPLGRKLYYFSKSL